MDPNLFLVDRIQILSPGTSVADPDPHGSAFKKSLLDLDPHGQIRIRIQKVKSLENIQVHEVNTELEDQK